YTRAFPPGLDPNGHAQSLPKLSQPMRAIKLRPAPAIPRLPRPNFPQGAAKTGLTIDRGIL
ncbi:MAG TPA: hypothetical protein VMW70_17465, partial [Burkholderiales bacterium]|nr:hypothetical protein [Burkholderiales bacterium]